MIHRFIRNTWLLIPLGLMLALVSTSCDDNSFGTVRYDDIGPFDTTGVERVVAPNGLIIYIHETGHGDVVAESQTVRLRYTGRTTDGDIFDSSYRNEVDVATVLSLRNMIPGFMQGLAGFNVEVDGQTVRMHAAREGSMRTLVIPPSLAYGNSSTHQLREETLIFDIDLVSIASEN
jgi:FKBP-type peptidyl-prolyl cis-trans isomerase FkpA